MLPIRRQRHYITRRAAYVIDFRYALMFRHALRFAAIATMRHDSR